MIALSLPRAFYRYSVAYSCAYLIAIGLEHRPLYQRRDVKARLARAVKMVSTLHSLYSATRALTEAMDPKWRMY